MGERTTIEYNKGDGTYYCDRLFIELFRSSTSDGEIHLKDSASCQPGHYFYFNVRETHDHYFIVNRFHDRFYEENWDKFIEDEKDQAQDHLNYLIMRWKVDLGIHI